MLNIVVGQENLLLQAGIYGLFFSMCIAAAGMWTFLASSCSCIAAL